MIDDLDRRLIQWVQGVHQKITVSLGPPEDPPSGKGISLYLLSLASQPIPRGPKPPPLRLSLRYLVSAWAEKAEEAHRLLGELLFAALEDPTVEVEHDPVAPEVWSALELLPRPGFFIRALLQRDRPLKEMPLVRKPLILRKAPLRPLSGKVMGPKDMPLAGARVELPATGLWAKTGRDGGFVFPAVPGDPAPRSVRVIAKGTTREIRFDQEPVIIRIEKWEA